MASKSIIRPCTLVYLIMIALTLITWWIGKTAQGGLQLSLMVLAFALVKGQMVGDWFMGLREVGGLWRWPIFIWLFVPGGLIATAFLLSYGG